MSPPITLDIAPFLSEKSQLWKACGIRGLFPLEHIPGMISLLAGRPNTSTFPFDSITMKLKPTLAGMPAASGDEDPFTISLEEDELNEALQCVPPLPTCSIGADRKLMRAEQWLEKFQSHVHKRVPDASWDVTVGSGSQDLMYKACEALISDGDHILLETPVYPGTLGFLAALPGTLVDDLLNWETTHPGKPYPKLLYTIPSGSNPTGASIPEHRKIEVLKLAKKYNFLILEDDAYAFVYYGPEGQQARSYFALEPEVNGENGTFDSFSKVLSSGMRLGYMTASPRLSAVVNMITSNTNLQPSSLAQVMAYALLSRWGPEGFLAHCAGVAAFYRARRDVFERVARKHLSGLAEWTSPIAGMFLYIKLLVHPDGRDADSEEIVRVKAVSKGVLAEDKADEACQRLREAILEARAEAVAAVSENA
ncbi:pyridoxal phosphate-dependent transferase [Mycena olivaceomarginata]|nr:pyridoxal phosphate-dependent transferase [Mycena olivaceomarginata]